DDLDSMGVKSITFSGGGEPLSYRYMTETLEKLSKTDIKFASLTNGSKLNGDIANLFSKFGTWLRVSIDGFDDESYAKYRNVKV
ncbi:radical SAM protein, partial [Campylobacter fetus]